METLNQNLLIQKTMLINLQDTTYFIARKTPSRYASLVVLLLLEL